MHRTTPASAAGSVDETASDPNTPKPAKPGLLINRNFALLWSGQTISVLGDFAFSTTLAVWVFTLVAGQAWAPLAIAAVYVATALPMIVVGPLAGVFADRWNKRRTMLATDALRVALVAALIPATGVIPLGFLSDLPFVGETLGALTTGGGLPLEWKLGMVYAVVFVVNSADQFFRPSLLALLGDLVSDAYRGRAMGLNQASISLAMLLGSLVAPPLVVSVGAQWTLAFDALTFVVSYFTVRAIHPPAAARSLARGVRGHVAREFFAGISFSLRSRVLRTLLVAGFLVMLGGGVLNALDIFFVTGNLRTPVTFYGVLTAAMGAGMIAGSILAAMFAHRLGYARGIWLSLLGIGAAITVYSRLTSFGPALALMAAVGVLQALLNVAVGPLLLSVTPRTLIGRTNALLNLALTVASLAGTVVAGYVAGTLLQGFSASAFGLRFGPIDTIFSASGLVAIAGAIYCALNLRAKTVARERVAEPDDSAPDDPETASHTRELVGLTADTGASLAATR